MGGNGGRTAPSHSARVAGKTRRRMFSGARQRPRSESESGWECRAAIREGNGPLDDLRLDKLVEWNAVFWKGSAVGRFADAHVFGLRPAWNRFSTATFMARGVERMCDGQANQFFGHRRTRGGRGHRGASGIFGDPRRSREAA